MNRNYPNQSSNQSIDWAEFAYNRARSAASREQSHALGELLVHLRKLVSRRADGSTVASDLTHTVA